MLANLDMLGDELATLVGRIGTPVEEATPIATWPSAVTKRSSFRLRFADGRILKGKRLATVQCADRVTRLSGSLNAAHFPPVLARLGSSYLTNWIDGIPLTDAECDASLLRRIGALHGMLHCLQPAPNWCEYYAREARIWHRSLATDLDDLVTADALCRADAECALDRAMRRVSENPQIGLCHGDYCRENIVLSSGNSFSVIDNENISIDACDYDLARTEYRWPMTAEQRREYFAGYRRYRSSASYFEHREFWRICVLVQSARFHVHKRTGGADQPLRLLRQLMRPAE